MVDIFNRRAVRELKGMLAAQAEGNARLEERIAELTARLEQAEERLRQLPVRATSSLDELIQKEWFNGAEAL